ncbi:glycoside hydrolase [Lentinus tigrinus ALCF2SS1-7]|uniref:Glycoside hydrolase n=1 Tax=Lentinus tigrinus ALCF2SS1-6 TaxID=1328759 RepID=A0A5C2SDK8_9APHY|nr:glycoside hydrolase [Lentinus tigrinus ALCF2SS1-6]RPD74360.1 glycoside hydrolase [Lentinus tigrinus ALCF2SS1-7]
MPYRIVALLLFLALFPRHAVGHTIPRPDTQSLHARAVSNTSKAGLPWPNGNYIDVGQYLSTGKVQWYYTWNPSSANLNADLEFVPMLWGERQVAQWGSTINDTIQSSKVTHVLGFNEPEISGQSNMSPSDGAALWKAHIEPLKAQGIHLGSPAPSGAPAGKQWLLDWMDQCQGGCTVDFIAVHYYDINSTGFMEYLTDYHNTFQRPVWVTEWACQNFNDANAQCSQQDVVDFMNATQEFMDNTDWVERYAWFGAMEDMQGVNTANALMTSQGKMNTLGEQYIGAVIPNVSSGYQPGVVHGGSGSSSSGSRPSGAAGLAVSSLALWVGVAHTIYALS